MEQNAVEGATLIERGKSYIVEIPSDTDKDILAAYADLLHEEYGANFIFFTNGSKIDKFLKNKLFGPLISEVRGMLCLDLEIRSYCNHCALLEELIEIIKEQ